jgi:hypothetical protein
MILLQHLAEGRTWSLLPFFCASWPICTSARLPSIAALRNFWLALSWAKPGELMISPAATPAINHPIVMV